MAGKKNKYFDVFGYTMNEEEIILHFAKRSEEVDPESEIQESQLMEKTSISIPPEYLAPIVKSLVEIGVSYQEKTGKHVGFGENPEDQSEEN